MSASVCAASVCADSRHSASGREVGRVPSLGALHRDGATRRRGAGRANSAGRGAPLRVGARRRAAARRLPHASSRSKKKKKKKRTPRSGRANLPQRRRRDRPRGVFRAARRRASVVITTRPVRGLVRDRVLRRVLRRVHARVRLGLMCHVVAFGRAPRVPRPPRPRLASLLHWIGIEAPAPPRSPRASGFLVRAGGTIAASALAGPQVSRGTSGRARCWSRAGKEGQMHLGQSPRVARVVEACFPAFQMRDIRRARVRRADGLNSASRESHGTHLSGPTPWRVRVFAPRPSLRRDPIPDAEDAEVAPRVLRSAGEAAGRWVGNGHR